jgi:uncharacterized protein YbjT (DUF2867 family)
MTEHNRNLVAVAGGIGGIGRHIVDGILATGKYTVKVFTRQDPSSASDLTAKGAVVVKVDYSDHTSLVKELQGVHTAIATLFSNDDSFIQSHLNLLDACLEAKVKRFAPSELSGNNGSNTVIQLYRELKTPVREKVKASGIEYTLFLTGIFMDYCASPQKASSSLNNLIIGVDFNKGEANIVGTGDDPFCLTRGEDVGRFVAAALDLEKWDEKLGMVGSRTTWNELIKLGEQVRGKKFHVKRQTVEEAMEGRHPNPPNRIINFLAEAFTAICQGEFDIEPNLNEKFPQITPMAINEFIQQWWGGKEGEIYSFKNNKII